MGEPATHQIKVVPLRSTEVLPRSGKPTKLPNVIGEGRQWEPSPVSWLTAMLVWRICLVVDVAHRLSFHFASSFPRTSPSTVGPGALGFAALGDRLGAERHRAGRRLQAVSVSASPSRIPRRRGLMWTILPPCRRLMVSTDMPDRRAASGNGMIRCSSIQSGLSSRALAAPNGRRGDLIGCGHGWLPLR